MATPTFDNLDLSAITLQNPSPGGAGNGLVRRFDNVVFDFPDVLFEEGRIDRYFYLRVVAPPAFRTWLSEVFMAHVANLAGLNKDLFNNPVNADTNSAPFSLDGEADNVYLATVDREGNRITFQEFNRGDRVKLRVRVQHIWYTNDRLTLKMFAVAMKRLSVGSLADLAYAQLQEF